MAARPSTTATWATTTNYATSNDPAAVGQPTKNDPSSIAAQGWDYASRPDPTFLNHWQNRVGTWIGWVKDNAFGTDGGTFVLDDVLELQAQGITFSTLASCIIASTGGFFVVPGATAQISGTMRWMSTGVLQLDSGMTITGTPAFTGTLWNWSAPQSVTSTLTFSGNGHKRDRIIAGANGNDTYGINNGDEVLIPNQTGADHTYTLSTTGASDGSRMRFSALANTGSFYVQIATAEGTFFLRNLPGGAGGLITTLDVVYFSGAWHASAAIPAQAL